MTRPELGELQALVTGTLIGALMTQQVLDLEVTPVMDDQGYLPEIRIRGRGSNDRLVIKVEQA